MPLSSLFTDSEDESTMVQDLTITAVPSFNTKASFDTHEETDLLDQKTWTEKEIKPLVDHPIEYGDKVCVLKL